MSARTSDILRCDVFAAFLDLAGNREQRLQFVGDLGGNVILLDPIDELVISPKCSAAAAPCESWQKQQSFFEEM